MTDYVFNWFALPLALTALCSLAVGISILRREWRSRVGAALFLVTTTISVWFGASAFAYCSANAGTAVFWTRIEYMAVPVLPAAIYLYIAVGLRIYHRQKFLIWTLFVTAVAFTGFVHMTDLLVSGVVKHWWGYYPVYGLAGPFFVGYFVLLIALGTLQLRGRLREIPKGSPFHERITMSLVASAVISVGAIDFVAKFGVPLYPMGYLGILGFLAVILVLERRHRVVYMTPAVAAGQILSTMQGAVLVTTREGRIEMGNRAAGQLLGYSDAGLLELSLEQVFGSEAEWPLLLADCLAGQDVRDRETSWRHRNGTEMSMSVSASVLTDHRGEPLGTVFVGLDITARKTAEEALRLTQVSVDRAADLIHWVSPDGLLLYVSDSSCRRYGYSREELLGMSVFDLDPTQSPEAWRLHWNELKEQGSLSLQTVHRTKDGEIFPVEVTVNYIQSGGKEYNFSFARDITERRLWEERLATERNYLSLLNEAAVEMSHCLTTTEVQKVGVRLAHKATHCDGGVIWLLPTVSRRQIAWSEDLTRHGRRQLAGVLRTSKAVERVLNEQRPAHLGLADLPSTPSAGVGAFADATLVPITSRGRSLGLVCLATKPGHPGLSSQDSALAAGIAALVGVALENARLYDDARYLAERDPVTGLLNHRGINSELEKELSRNERSGGCFSVVMMDLDNFKLFNDTYGHVVGDQVLQKVSSILGSAVRRADLVGRYGGDEFVAVLPDTDTIGAMRTVERIRRTMRESGFKADGGSPVPVFMSTAWPPIPSMAGMSANSFPRPTPICTALNVKAATA
jgi:diguanylate cyclase (GGDEF)-like protein/PAS domain S-box-containing protein